MAPDGEQELYEPGDVNVAQGPSRDVNGPGGQDDVDQEFDDDLDDEMDDDFDDDLEEGPGNGTEDAEDEASGNRATGGTATAVLTYLARALASEPQSVEVEVEERRGSVVLRLHVAPEDMGRVIGRRGRTAQAIRTLVGVAGDRDGVQTSVDIVDA